MRVADEPPLYRLTGRVYPVVKDTFGPDGTTTAVVSRDSLTAMHSTSPLTDADVVPTLWPHADDRPRTTTIDSLGGFSFDSIPAGLFTIGVELVFFDSISGAQATLLALKKVRLTATDPTRHVGFHVSDFLTAPTRQDIAGSTPTSLPTSFFNTTRAAITDYVSSPPFWTARIPGAVRTDTLVLRAGALDTLFLRIGPPDRSSVLPVDPRVVALTPPAVAGPPSDSIRLMAVLECDVCAKQPVQIGFLSYSATTLSTDEVGFPIDIPPSAGNLKGSSEIEHLHIRLFRRNTELPGGAVTIPFFVDHVTGPGRKAYLAPSPRTVGSIPAESTPKWDVRVKLVERDDNFSIQLETFNDTLSSLLKRLTRVVPVRSIEAPIAWSVELGYNQEWIHEAVNGFNRGAASAMNGTATVERFAELFSLGGALYNRIISSEPARSAVDAIYMLGASRGSPVRLRAIDPRGLSVPWQFLARPTEEEPRVEDFWGMQFEVSAAPHDNPDRGSGGEVAEAEELILAYPSSPPVWSDAAGIVAAVVTQSRPGAIAERTSEGFLKALATRGERAPLLLLMSSGGGAGPEPHVTLAETDKLLVREVRDAFALRRVSSPPVVVLPGDAGGHHGLWRTFVEYRARAVVTPVTPVVRFAMEEFGRRLLDYILAADAPMPIAKAMHCARQGYLEDLRRLGVSPLYVIPTLSYGLYGDPATIVQMATGTVSSGVSPPRCLF